jgi:DNA-binding GntR family transcriptional regulator
MMKPIKTVRNLKAEAYRIIRESISTGHFPPGAPLKESELARELGVSRTPVREALNQLSKEGLVQFISGRGAFVHRWSRDEVVEVLLIREVLEGLAARLAAVQLTPADIEVLKGYMFDFRHGQLDYAVADKRFHEHIVNACGVARLVGLIRNLYDSIQMANMLRITFLVPGRVMESINEHDQLIEAFGKRDGDLAERLAREHFQHTRSFYLQFLGGETPSPAVHR